LTASNKDQSGNEVSSVTKSEIPVAPPSINLLGNKKLSKPKAAEAILSEIKKKYFKSLIKTFFSSLKPVQISKLIIGRVRQL